MAQVELKDISSHFTEEVVRKAFHSATDSDAKIKRIEVSRASLPGEEYLSSVSRVVVTGEDDSTVHFIVKGVLGNELIRKTVSSDFFFRKEAHFYNIILPAFVSLQKSQRAKFNIQDIVPKCYAMHIDGESDFILLEDVTLSGFRTVDKHLGMNDEESLLCISALAKFHALSYAMKRLDPDHLRELGGAQEEGYYFEGKRDFYSGYLANILRIAQQALVDDEPDPANSTYVSKLKSITSGDFYGQQIDMASARDDYSVIGHGDCWMPNFMLNDTTALILDFQTLRFASPILDLSFLIYSGTSQTFRDKYFEASLDLYHRTMTSYLADMHVNIDDVYPIEIFREHVKKFMKFGLGMSLSAISLLATRDKGSVADVLREYAGKDSIPLEKLWVAKELESPKAKKKLADVIRHGVDNDFI